MSLASLLLCWSVCKSPGRRCAGRLAAPGGLATDPLQSGPSPDSVKLLG